MSVPRDKSATINEYHAPVKARRDDSHESDSLRETGNNSLRVVALGGGVASGPPAATVFSGARIMQACPVAASRAPGRAASAFWIALVILAAMAAMYMAALIGVALGKLSLPLLIICPLWLAVSAGVMVCGLWRAHCQRRRAAARKRRGEGVVDAEDCL